MTSPEAHVDGEQDPIDPEISSERAYMAACRAALARMRKEAATALDAGSGEGDAVADKVLNQALRLHRKEQIASLSVPEGAPLFFGRLELDDDPEADARTTRHPGMVYVGRRGVRDEHGRHMVIDWRTPLAGTFYEASPLDPMGLRTRRRHGFNDDNVLTAFEDEPLDRPAEPGIGDALLSAQIERPRVGPMRDIVATIQPEQMRLVRAPLDRTMCVQGAPGTGKTAVGLHRLAYLLHRDRDRLQKLGGVAVIGPNHAFLTYISSVLPALGEFDISRATIDELLGERLRDDGSQGVLTDRSDDVRARIKGDIRMAEIVERLVWSRVEPPTAPIEVRHHHHSLEISPEEVCGEIDAIRDRGLDHGAGAAMLTDRLGRLLLRRMEESDGLTPPDALRTLHRNKDLRKAVRRIWPVADPVRLIFSLLTNGRTLAEVSDGLLSPSEQRALLCFPKPRSLKAMEWTENDLVLVDEAASLIERPLRLGHLVIDEAQDLTPMQLRALARRMAGSATILGDLAQTTSPTGVNDWQTVLDHLDRPDGVVEELPRGYRVPAQIIDYAARLLPQIAPGLTKPSSFRHSPTALHVVGTSTDQFARTITKACAGLRERPGSSGLIAARENVAGLQGILHTAGIPHTVLSDEDQGMGSDRLTLVPATLAKGLEFDDVVVVEPNHIVRTESHGLNHLYVALTRAVSSLHIVHTEPLPHALAAKWAL